MNTYWLKLVLLSDVTFGRGDGVAGIVDMEVQHDQNGLPYLSGKTLKGLLGAECKEILSATENISKKLSSRWRKSQKRLFGKPGSDADSHAILHFGAAELPSDLCSAIRYDLSTGTYTKEDVLNSLTELRRQTAMDPSSGAPKKESLRTIRVIRRQIPFISQLAFSIPPSNDDLALLSACVKVFRRAGTERHRGRGKLEAELFNEYPKDESVHPTSELYFMNFRQALEAA